MIIDTEQCALQLATTVLVELRALDEEELKDTSEYAVGGCNCKLAPDGGPCCRQFSPQQYQDMRSQCAQLSHNELDMVVMGQVFAMSDSQLTRHSITHRKKKIVSGNT